jgi:nucleotidyltransferase/DNA polymerase involved in DNA repair
MPMSQAVRICPELIIRPANFKAYGDASRAVMARLADLTPDVEQISIDEAFLDVTMLRDPAPEIARQLQTVINQELRLPCSLGVATNKLIAKIANNIGKDRAGKGAPPNAITVVPAGEEADFLAPLPVRELWGIGPKTAERLHRLGIHTIGALASLPDRELVSLFGRHGAEMALRARGIDERAVEREGAAKSVSKETTFARDVVDGDQLRMVMRVMSDEVGQRLRADGLHGTTIRIKLRWSDFTTLTRQRTLSHPTQHNDEIYAAACDLFDRVWLRGRPVRLIGVGVSGFSDAARQRSLWEDEAAADAQQERLEATLDDLQQRFGRGMIRRGSALTDDD